MAKGWNKTTIRAVAGELCLERNSTIIIGCNGHAAHEVIGDYSRLMSPPKPKGKKSGA